jgi:hypothetical protein
MSGGRKSCVERLEEKGTKAVRLQLRNEELEPDLVVPAIGWLQDKAAEEAEETNRTAQSASWAAWAAVALAVMAIIIAIVK